MSQNFNYVYSIPPLKNTLFNPLGVPFLVLYMLNPLLVNYFYFLGPEHHSMATNRMEDRLSADLSLPKPPIQAPPSLNEPPVQASPSLSDPPPLAPSSPGHQSLSEPPLLPPLSPGRHSMRSNWSELERLASRRESEDSITLPDNR